MLRLGLILCLTALGGLAMLTACSDDDPPAAEGLGFSLRMEPRTVGPGAGGLRTRLPGEGYRATVTIRDNRQDDEPDAPTLNRRRSCTGDRYRLISEGEEGTRSQDLQVRNCTAAFSFDGQGERTVRLEVVSDEGPDAPVVSSEAQTLTVRDFLIVSMGDSVASGEGNPDQGRAEAIFGDRTVWQNRQCHRSFRAGSAQAALEIERMDPGTTVTFLHLACSGARITTGLLQDYRGIEPDRGSPLAPQLTQLRDLLSDPAVGGSPERPRRVDALLLTIGANDLSFGTIVQRCLLSDQDDGDCEGARFNRDETVAEAVERRLRRLPDRYARLAACLGDGDCELGAPLDIDPERILITEYFDPTRSAPGRFCRYPRIPLTSRFDLTRSEARWAKRRVVDPLNEAVADAAERHGWSFVDGLAEDFATHGICRRPSQRWVVPISRSLAVQLGVAGGFHPDGQGHSCYRNRLTRALDAVLGDELAGEPPARSSCV